MKNRILGVVVGLVVFGGMAQAAFTTGFYETSENVNLRSSPKLGNNRIDYFPKGTQVLIKDVKGQWCESTHYKYSKAYLACRYLKEWGQDVIPLSFSSEDLSDAIETDIAKLYLGDRVAMYNLNVRSSARVGKNLIDNIKKGEIVKVVEKKGGWCKVNYKNYSKAYVYCRALGIEAKTFIETFSAE